MANHPKILLCDEATSALDPQTTQSVLELLKKINQEQKITIVMVTHEMDVIESICDHVAVMEAGKVIEQGSTIDIFSNPQHPTTKNFIQTVLHQQLPVHSKSIRKSTSPQHLLPTILRAFGSRTCNSVTY